MYVYHRCRRFVHAARAPCFVKQMVSYAVGFFGIAIELGIAITCKYRLIAFKNISNYI